MSKLIYDHQDGRLDLGFGAHPIFREPPQFIGSPDQDWCGKDDPRVLRVAVPLSGDRLNTRIGRTTLVTSLNSRLLIDSILLGFDFHLSWVLLHGPLSAFEKAGMLVLDRAHASGAERPTIVSGPALVSVGRRGRGDSSYSSHIAAAMAVVGAQLYLCEKVGSGAKPCRSRDGTIEHLTSILRPLRAHLRQQSHGAVFRNDDERFTDGSIGSDDPLYKSLLARGTPMIDELYAGRLQKVQIGRRWADIGAQLSSDTPADSVVPRAVSEAESVLRVAVDMACAAFQRERTALGLRLEAGSGDQKVQAVYFSQPDAETLFEAGLAGGRGPDIFALTRLAWLWDINPADFFGGLFAWRLHFAAARYLGNCHFGAEGVHLDSEAHWGLRAIRHDIFDTLLDDSAAAARAWLRGFMVLEDDFFEAPPPALDRATGVVPAWRFLRKRARRGLP